MFYINTVLGMKISPACFTILMNQVIAGIDRCEAYMCIDDIIVYNPQWQKHLETIIVLFDKFNEENLTISQRVILIVHP